MSESPPFDFGKFIPGFDFLRELSSAAAAGGATPPPGMTQWMAPTLSVEELDKRIGELKTVQFWLDQNAAALKASIQALEVQRMTLATLKGMQVSFGEMGSAFQAKAADGPAAGAPVRDNPQAGAAGREAPAAGTAGSVDPMQWWGALTRQFQQIAASALQDAAARAPAPATASPAGSAADPAPAKAAAKKPARKSTRREGSARSG